MNKYFTKPKSLGVNVKIELDLSSSTTKADLKNEKTDLANLQSDADKLDIDKLYNDINK